MGDWSAWVNYVMREAEKGKTNPVEHVAICGYKDCVGVWGSTGFLSEITCDEIKKLVQDPDALFQHGAYIAKKRCRLLNNHFDNPASLSCALKTKGDGGSEGVPVCVGKTPKVLVIAFGKPNVGAGPLTDWVYDTLQKLMCANC